MPQRPHQAPPRTPTLGTSLVSSHARQYVQLPFLLGSTPGSSDVTAHLLPPQPRMGPNLDGKCKHRCGSPHAPHGLRQSLTSVLSLQGPRWVELAIRIPA